MKKYFNSTILLIVNLVFTVCLLSCNTNNEPKTERAEDAQSKKTLQGSWANDVEGNIVFSFKGDTVYYNDSLSMPAAFYVVSDTLFIENHTLTAYPIKKLNASELVFVNAEGEEVELVKSAQNILQQGEHKGSVMLNQGKKVKKDTVLVSAEKRYHAYTQVNPTTYRVYRQQTNNDGLVIENVYYDNIVYIALYDGQKKVFGQNFEKKDFGALVPKEYLQQAILSDIEVEKVHGEGVRFVAILTIPDSYTNYRVMIDVSDSGTKKLSV